MKKLQSLLILTAFIISNHFNLPLSIASSAAVEPQRGAASISDVSGIQIPQEIGKIQEVYQSTKQETGAVILIQDAHAIPAAQRNIQKLIVYFQEQYGLNRVALEGAASRLDPQIFKSFPDKEVLQKTFEVYMDQSELTGTTAAAVFSEKPAIYQGVEDWGLYKEGLGFYLKAMEKKSELMEQLEDSGRRLQSEKERTYSKKLLELDQILQDFGQNETDLVRVLQKLSEVKKPEAGSELALLLEESQSGNKDLTALELELKRIAEEIQKVSDTVSDTVAFNQKRQAFRTSRISAAEFALFLKEWLGEFTSAVEPGADRNGLGTLKTIREKLNAHPDLSRLIFNHKRLRDIEGTEVFRKFEVYVRAVKETLIQNDAERELDAESRRLYLLERLAKLELTRDEWEEIRTKDQRLKTGDMWVDHFAFYENAKKRDEAFFKNLLEFMSQQKPRVSSLQSLVWNTSLLVAGGFHTEGLAGHFKKEGISYAVIRPNIDSFPDQTNYQAHMRGDVSWKDYYEVEDGMVDLYKAFVRGARDRLLRRALSVKREASDDNDSRDPLHASRLLKIWRDQIIRDLAKKEQLTKTHEYTKYLDELTRDGSQNTLVSGEPSLSNQSPRWLAKIDRFIHGLRGLESSGRLTEQNVLKLLRPSAMTDKTYLNIAAGSLLPVAQFPGVIIGTDGTDLMSLPHRENEMLVLNRSDARVQGAKPGPIPIPPGAINGRSEVRQGWQKDSMEHINRAVEDSKNLKIALQHLPEGLKQSRTAWKNDEPGDDLLPLDARLAANLDYFILKLKESEKRIADAGKFMDSLSDMIAEFSQWKSRVPEEIVNHEDFRSVFTRMNQFEKSLSDALSAIPRDVRFLRAAEVLTDPANGQPVTAGALQDLLTGGAGEMQHRVGEVLAKYGFSGMDSISPEFIHRLEEQGRARSHTEIRPTSISLKRGEHMIPPGESVSFSDAGIRFDVFARNPKGERGWESKKDEFLIKNQKLYYVQDPLSLR
ncbi:MAG TPA: hypothetical protein VD913_00705, partial [bacterium]|nr:hypothetical protein [bacterium]